jgi:hypothetical protein
MKILNLALMKGNPHYFPSFFFFFGSCWVVLCLLFLCFSGQVFAIQVWGSVHTLCLTCTIPRVLYFLTHWGQCVILVWGWGRHFCHFICLFVLFVFIFISFFKKYCCVIDWA